jgi:hypothetical protein
MIKFFKNISFFFIILISIFLGLFFMIDNGLKKSNHLEYAEWNTIYNGKASSDIIVQGSSRAWRQVNPKIIEDKIDLTVFNLGMDGYHFPMQKLRYDIYNKNNNQPKVIIQILDHFTLKKRENLFNKHQFIPYLNDTTLSNFIQNYDGFSWSDFNIPYFAYFGSKEISIAGVLEYLNLKEFKSTKYKGFESTNKTWENDFDLEKSKNPNGKRVKLDTKVFNELDEFVFKSKKENIKIILVYPPDYSEFQDYLLNHDSIINIYSNLALKHNINFIDFSKDKTLCGNKDLFYNPTHLNTQGSKKFSEQLGDSIFSIINLHD